MTPPPFRLLATRRSTAVKIVNSGLGMLPTATPAAVPKVSRLDAEPASAGAPTALVATRINAEDELQREEHAVRDRLAHIEKELQALQGEQSALRARSSGLERQRQARAKATVYDTALREEIRAKSQALGYPSPRDFQLDGVSSVLGGTHTAVIWPAGGGKGLLTVLTAAMLTRQGHVCGRAPRRACQPVVRCHQWDLCREAQDLGGA